MPGPIRPCTCGAPGPPDCGLRPPAPPPSTGRPASWRTASPWRRSNSCSRPPPRRSSGSAPATGSTDTPDARGPSRVRWAHPAGRVATPLRALAASGRKTLSPRGRNLRGRPDPDARRSCRVPAGPAPAARAPQAAH
ncbi:hypothetical protein G6F35_014704 [Rhizopus arrhizus]|nr:hypothetical protein G6F35_014704 [Rhizopus arrhizus]